jgi:lipoate-protein ligase B
MNQQCKHQRYTIDTHEQTGYCHDCKAEGRMVFVVNSDDKKHCAIAVRDWIKGGCDIHDIPINEIEILIKQSCAAGR